MEAKETRRRSFLDKLVDSLGIKDTKLYKALSKQDRKRFELHTEIQFHKDQLNKIRTALGKKCTYISHYQKSAGNFIKANLMTPTGKRTFNFKLQVVPSKMNENDYAYILKQLKKAV